MMDWVWPFVHAREAIHYQLVSKMWRSSIHANILPRRDRLHFADETPLLEILARVKLADKQVSSLSFQIQSDWGRDNHFDELLKQLSSNATVSALSIGFHKDMGDSVMAAATRRVFKAIENTPCHTLSLCYSLVYFGLLFSPDDGEEPEFCDNFDNKKRRWIQRPVSANTPLCKLCRDKLTGCFLVGNCSKCEEVCAHSANSNSSCRPKICQECSATHSDREYWIFYSCCQVCARLLPQTADKFLT